MKNENRGKWAKVKAIENKILVEKFYKVFPEGTLAECKKITGLSFPTIAKYRDELKDEVTK